MTQLGTFGMSIVFGILCSGWASPRAKAQAQSTPAGGTKAESSPVSTQQVNDAFVQQLQRRIAGHEKEPASRVFKNIQLDFFKKTPAATFLIIMNQGYSAALGVTCAHCHTPDDFSRDDKRPKRAAREMALMHFGINQQLARMQNLESNPQGHFINCSTCHRGKINPLAEP